MNCSQCGAPVENGLKFCTQCGARLQETADPIEDMLEKEFEEETAGDYVESVYYGDIEEEDQDNTSKEGVFTRPVVKSKPRKHKMNGSGNYGSIGNRAAMGERYQWENLTGVKGFAETLLAIIVNPIASGEELFIRLSKATTLIYCFAMIMLTSCMSYLLYSTLASRTAKLFYDLFAYIWGYGTVEYVLQELNIQVLLLAVLSNILLIAYVTLLIMAIYKIILKTDIEWIECVQLMMMPMVISFFGQVIILIVGLLNVRVALVLGIILMILTAVLAVVQFINRLGLNAITVYSMPVIYVVSSLSQIIVIFGILKSYFH